MSIYIKKMCWYNGLVSLFDGADYLMSKPSLENVCGTI